MGAGGGPIAGTPPGDMTYHAYRKEGLWQGVYVQHTQHLKLAFLFCKRQKVA